MLRGQDNHIPYAYYNYLLKNVENNIFYKLRLLRRSERKNKENEKVLLYDRIEMVRQITCRTITISWREVYMNCAIAIARDLDPGSWVLYRKRLGSDATLLLL